MTDVSNVSLSFVNMPVEVLRFCVVVIVLLVFHALEERLVVVVVLWAIYSWGLPSGPASP